MFFCQLNVECIHIKNYIVYVFILLYYMKCNMHHTVLYYTILYYTILYYTILSYPILYYFHNYIILCYIIVYYDMLGEIISFYIAL